MAKYTAYNLVHAINQLDKNKNYNYINPGTKGLIHIENVILPSGPIQIRRWDPSKNKTYNDAQVESISSEMIWRITNAISEGDPINFDRILGGSYNTRSVLETLMALTPEFYYCYPGRILDVDGQTRSEHGHKHLIWLPNEPHQQGVLHEKSVPNMEISEIPIKTVTYDGIIIPPGLTLGEDIEQINIKRRHTQIQIALYLIGLQLGYRTWIAQNDQGVIYKDKPLIQQRDVVTSLANESIISAFPGAEPTAKFIDVIWFQNHRYMPAVMEVEHSTGVTSGLTRMQRFHDMIPSFKTRYVIVAPDELREKVVEEANRSQFKELEARYFSYTSVEELYSLCVHRRLKGITQEFLDCYMEKVCIS